MPLEQVVRIQVESTVVDASLKKMIQVERRDYKRIGDDTHYQLMASSVLKFLSRGLFLKS